MSNPTKVHIPSSSYTLAGLLYPPAPSSPSRHGAAIVISHPMTGVKEQTSATHARALSAAGFHALTFDAAHQGESSGSPRGLEDPAQRVEDIKAAVTHLAAAEGVDGSRVGVLGVCASGGYASAAAASDGRVAALATVSAACVGRLTRCGGIDEASNAQESKEAVEGALKAAGEWRAKEARGEAGVPPKMFDAEKVGEDADSFFKDAAGYYGTKRGWHERSDQRVPLSSYDLMVFYDSFNFQHLIAPRPLLMIAGSEAQSLHYSKTAVKAAREPKELFVVEGCNHFDLYDNLEESGPKLVEFFGKYLAKDDANGV